MSPDAIPSDTVPSNTAPSNTAPSNTAPSNTAPSDTVSSERASSDAVSSDAGWLSPALRAIVRREVTTTLHNRYLQVFAALLLVGSGTVVGTSGAASSVAFGMLLLLLYVVPLFAVLVGVHAAHEDAEERALLLSHPVPRGTYVLGKLATLAGAFALVLTLALAPTAWRVASAAPVAVLGGLGLALILIWGSTGLAVGAWTASRSRGLMGALCAWFGSLVLYDLATLALAGAMQAWPSAWVALLLLNPSDAVRLAGMTALEGVAFTAPGSSAGVATLLAWTPAWVGVLTVAWTVGMAGLARAGLRRP